MRCKVVFCNRTFQCKNWPSLKGGDVDKIKHDQNEAQDHTTNPAGLICRSQVAGRGLQVIVSPIQKVS